MDFISVWLTCKVMLVSGVQQSKSVVHIPVPFHILFLHRLFHSIEYISLCYRVGRCYLSVLYIVVCRHQPQPSNLSLATPTSLLW